MRCFDLLNDSYKVYDLPDMFEVGNEDNRSELNSNGSDFSTEMKYAKLSENQDSDGKEQIG
jgi:hypothetical protein